MTLITHENFIGEYEYVKDEGIFFGKIANITDLVTFESCEPANMEREFRLAIEDYESLCDEVDKPCQPDPIAHIKLIMKIRGLKQKDMVGIIGDKTMVSKVLNRKRKLTLEAIRNLESAYGIPFKIIAQDYKLKP